MRKLLLVLMAALVFTSCGKDGDEPEVNYTVTFNADGGTPAPQSQTVKAGEKATVPASPTKQGYVFLFWHLSGSTTAYNFATPVTSNIILQAKWESEAVAEYWQVAWNLDGGTWPATGDNHATRVVKGGTLAEPTPPTKAGKAFDGWYKEAVLTNKINFPYNVSAVTANFTLYAKWNDPAAEYWNITWELNGGAWPSTGDNHVDKVEKGTTLAEPVAPTKSGSSFDGWYKEAAFTNKVSFPATVTGDFKLYAKWGTAQLSVSPSTPISFTKDEGASDVITVTTNQPSWNATSNQPWCSIVRKEEIPNTFAITVSANTSNAKRTATVTVSAGAATVVNIQVEQALGEDLNFKKAVYCLPYIIKVTNDKRNLGLNTTSISGIANVFYNPNNTLSYMLFSQHTAFVPFSANWPLTINATSFSSQDEAARQSFFQINSGTYDYVNDPAKVVAYFGDTYGSSAFTSLANLRKITNNNSITQEIYSEMFFQNNSYKLIIYGKNDNGVLIGKYVGFVANGNSFSYWHTDPDDPNFGMHPAPIRFP